MIFWSILKIIGLIFLLLFGVLCLLLLLVLFTPVSYKAKGMYKSITCNNFSLKLHFLFFAVYAKVEYTEEIKYVLRIFGIPILGYPKKVKKKKVKEEKKVHECKKEDEVETLTATSIPEKRNEQKKEEKEASDKEQKKTTKDSVISKLLDFLKEEDNREYLKFILKKTKKIFQNFLPKKLLLHMDFAASNPCDTGMIFGVISMFPFVYKKGIKITPDFTSQKEYLHMDFQGKGYIFLWKFIIVIFEVLKNKYTKTIIESLK